MLQTPYRSCTHFCLHEIACNIHASVFFLIYLIGGQLLYNIMFCHSSTRIGHSYTRVSSILNPAQASDRPSLPLPPPPQGQASLARGPVLQRALMRPRPGICSVLSLCPSLQLGKTLTLIFSSFFFFQENVLQRDPLCLPDPAFGRAPKSCQLREARRRYTFAGSGPPMAQCLSIFFHMIILLRSPFRHFSS